MREFMISGFADEICDDFETQLQVVTKLGMKYICVRSVSIDGIRKSIADTTVDEARDVLLPLLNKYNVKVSSIGSPIGKINVGDEEAFATQLTQLDTLCQIANVFGAKYMRMFSFYIPNEEDPATYKDEIFSKIAKFISVCDKYGIIPIHENEKGIYGDIGPRCLELLEHFKSTSLRCAYDFANFVQCDDDPVEAYKLVKPYIEYIHIKDADAKTGKNVLCGTGDGHIGELLADVFASGYNGFLTMEPHLHIFSSLKTLEQGDVSDVIAKNTFDDGASAYGAQYKALCDILKTIA